MSRVLYDDHQVGDENRVRHEAGSEPVQVCAEAFNHWPIVGLWVYIGILAGLNHLVDNLAVIFIVGAVGAFGLIFWFREVYFD